MRSAARSVSPPPNTGILGRSELISRLASRSLVISPILSEEQLGAASIDLRMGTVVLMVRARGSSHVDPSAYKAHGNRNVSYALQLDQRQKHERHEIPFEQRFLLHPGTVALVPTLEWVRFPPDLLGYVTARSTWAREGLSIATAAFIEPRYQGIITLELSNLGQVPLALYPGLRIAQIAFASVQGDTARPHKRQFDLSFEPKQGDIAKEDDYPFLPSSKKGCAPKEDNEPVIRSPRKGLTRPRLTGGRQPNGRPRRR
jgi:dCTP deaminase